MDNCIKLSPSRREVLALLAAGLGSGASWSQDFPSRPIRMVITSGPAGGVDNMARLLGPRVGEELKTTVILDNKPGANGLLAGELVAKAAPDGYTILWTAGSSVAIAPQMVAKPPFDPLTDLVPVATIGASPLAMAMNPNVGVRNLAEFVAQARTRELKLASTGIGSLTHMTIELLSQATGGKIIHVPYKGGGAALADVLAGHVDAALSDVSTYTPHFADGRLLPIAFSSERRLDIMPAVPTLSEAIRGFTAYSWYGVFAPARTPRPIVDRISGAFMKAAAREEAQLRRQAVVPLNYPTPDAFARFFAEEYKRFGILIKEKKLVSP